MRFDLFPLPVAAATTNCTTNPLAAVQRIDAKQGPESRKDPKNSEDDLASTHLMILVTEQEASRHHSYRLDVVGPGVPPHANQLLVPKSIALCLHIQFGRASAHRVVCSIAEEHDCLVDTVSAIVRKCDGVHSLSLIQHERFACSRS